LAEGASRGDQLEAIVAASRLRARQVLLRGTWWHHDNGPLLVYRADDQAPMALLPLTPRRYHLVDPATGSATPVTATVAETLGAFAVQLYRPLPDRALGKWELFRFNRRELSSNLRSIALLSVLCGLLALAAPLATAYLVDAILPAGQRSQLLLLGLALAVGALAVGAFEISRNIALLRLEGRVDAALQAAVWDRLISLPATFFRAYAAGDLAERAMGVSSARQRLSDIALSASLAAVFSLFSLGMLFAIDWRLALLTLTLVGIFAGVSWIAFRLQLHRQRLLSAQEGQLAGLVLQLILGIAKLRIAGAERRAFAQWATRFIGQKQQTVQVETVSNLLAVWYVTFPILATTATIAAVMLGGGPHLSLAAFLAFSVAQTQLVVALLGLGAALGKVAGVLPLYERALPIVEAPPEVEQTRHHPGVLTGALALERVSFRYREDGPLILDNVSLDICPGEFVALVGPSGSGKSTLLRLLLGFERPTSGTVSYDGQDLVALDLRAVRRQMGVVLQHSSLMSDDIFHNIVGAAPLSVDDAWAAARLVGLDEEIKRLPMGMYTMISEGGGTFSGGQRQRILLARALARRPRMLLLDEATSALDNAAQAVVARSLATLAVTRVVIAHRLSTIIHADRILVLAGGKVVQCGTHAELMSQGGMFAELVRRQRS
jgi:ATP-binding cassette subfamily C protein